MGKKKKSQKKIWKGALNLSMKGKSFTIDPWRNPCRSVQIDPSASGRELGSPEMSRSHSGAVSRGKET